MADLPTGGVYREYKSGLGYPFQYPKTQKSPLVRSAKVGKVCWGGMIPKNSRKRKKTPAGAWGVNRGGKSCVHPKSEYFQWFAGRVNRANTIFYKLYFYFEKFCYFCVHLVHPP